MLATCHGPWPTCCEQIQPYVLQVEGDPDARSADSSAASSVKARGSKGKEPLRPGGPSKRATVESVASSNSFHAQSSRPRDDGGNQEQALPEGISGLPEATESVTVALQRRREAPEERMARGHEEGTYERLFSGAGRVLDLWKEPLMSSADRFHATDNLDYDPLLPYGVEGDYLPGR